LTAEQKDWPTPLSGLADYLRQPAVLRRSAAFCAVFSLGCLLVQNPYAVGMAGMSPASAEHYRFQLSLVAMCFYTFPLLAALLAHDFQAHVEALTMKWGGSQLPPYARAEISRVVFQTRILALFVLAASCFVAACVLGCWMIWSHQVRVIGIILVYVVASIYGMVFLVFGCGLSRLLGSSDKTMLALMATLAAIYVGIPIVSDVLLLREVGQMPLPGSAEWCSYLPQISGLWGIRIYSLSPPELFLLFGTQAFAAGKSPPLWQAATAMVFFLIPVWLFFGVAGRLGSRRKGDATS